LRKWCGGGANPEGSERGGDSDLVCARKLWGRVGESKKEMEYNYSSKSRKRYNKAETSNLT
jgi:hypothetical protein